MKQLGEITLDEFYALIKPQQAVLWNLAALRIFEEQCAGLRYGMQFCIMALGQIGEYTAKAEDLGMDRLDIIRSYKSHYSKE